MPKGYPHDSKMLPNHETRLPFIPRNALHDLLSTNRKVTLMLCFGPQRYDWTPGTKNDFLLSFVNTWIPPSCFCATDLGGLDIW